MERTMKEKVQWLDTCHECTKQNPLMKKKRCAVWYAVATNSPMCQEAMNKAENEMHVCAFFEPKTTAN